MMRATAAAAVLARSSPGALYLRRTAAIRRTPTPFRGLAVSPTGRLADLAGVDSEEAERRGASVSDATLEVHASASTSGARSVVDPHLASLKGMRFEELESWLVSVGERPQRAAQLFSWMYRRGKLVEDFESMEDVSQKFRDTLGSIATVEGDLEMESIKTATDGTRKVLYRLKNGGGVVESVIIPSNTGPDGRTTVCVSSQLGCAMNCQFCFTAKMGLRKNLTAAQIVEQVVHARRLTGGGRGADVRQREETTNVVFMGMGEPLHNVDAVLTAVDVLTDPRGLAFSRNKVTVSTSGLVPEIERYLKESSGSLAVSLNATTDEIRSWIMPINRKYNLERLLGTLRENFPRQGAGRHQRHVFFEYILLAGINDSDEDAERLLEISRSMPSKFNLIYFNTHEGSEFRCSDEATIKAFRQKLVDGGAMATIRASRGDEEMAACGQLGSPDAPEDWKPAPPKLPKPRRLR
jgi:23S rRNA (adenine2503-C2)-methyltransferase